MNYYYTLIFFLFLTTSISAQIAFENIDNKKDTTYYPYDSTSNYPTLKNIAAFKGQTFFVARMEELQFVIFPIQLRTRLPEKALAADKKFKNKKSKQSKYPTDTYFPHPYEFSSNSNKDSLLGCYFYVQDVVKYESKYYFKLLDKKRNTIVYFLFHPISRDPYPFLTLGFYEKEKLKIGKTFYVYNSIAIKNIITKERVDFSGADLTIDRIVIDKKTYAFYYILKDKKGTMYKIIGSKFESILKNIRFKGD